MLLSIGLVSARVRSEWRRLRDRKISSIWSPASQELSVVGNAGVGEIVSRVLHWPCLLLLLLGFRGFLVLEGQFRCLVPFRLSSFHASGCPLRLFWC